MQPNEIREASATDIALFLDAGRDVEQGHLRAALANALTRIAALEKQMRELSGGKR